MTDLPPLAAGQTWAPTRPGSRAKARMVFAVEAVSVARSRDAIWGYVAGDDRRWLWWGYEFTRWVRRHAARPVTP